MSWIEIFLLLLITTLGISIVVTPLVIKGIIFIVEHYDDWKAKISINKGEGDSRKTDKIRKNQLCKPE